MTCSICQSSLLDPRRQRTTGNNVTSTASINSRISGIINKYQPTALGCGHTFHKACVQQWFTSSTRTSCPLCQKLHEGPVLTLYIDTADSTMLPSTPNTTSRVANKPKGSAEGETNQSPDTATQPVGDGRNELLDRIEELETLLDRQTRAMEQQYTREKEQLEAQLLVKENEVVYLRMKIVEQEWTIDDLHYEKDKFKRKSEGHRNHIILLQKELKDSEAHIDEIANDLADADAEVNDLQSTIEDVENKIEKSERRSEARRKQTLLLRKKLKDSEAREDEVIRDLEDAYAKIKRLEGSVENFKAGVERLTSKSNKLIKNINVLKKQHQTNEEYLYEANDEIHRLTSLSDSHRSQINSLQKLVKKKNAIISRLEDELSENVNDYYY